MAGAATADAAMPTPAVFRNSRRFMGVPSVWSASSLQECPAIRPVLGDFGCACSSLRSAISCLDCPPSQAGARGHGLQGVSPQGRLRSAGAGLGTELLANLMRMWEED